MKRLYTLQRLDGERIEIFQRSAGGQAAFVVREQHGPDSVTYDISDVEHFVRLLRGRGYAARGAAAA